MATTSLSIRKDSELGETPLVALTGHGQPQDRKRTADAGFDEHLTKPMDLDALNDMLGRLERRDRSDGTGGQRP